MYLLIYAGGQVKTFNEFDNAWPEKVKFGMLDVFKFEGGEFYMYTVPWMCAGAWVEIETKIGV